MGLASLVGMRPKGLHGCIFPASSASESFCLFSHSRGFNKTPGLEWLQRGPWFPVPNLRLEHVQLRNRTIELPPGQQELVAETGNLFQRQESDAGHPEIGRFSGRKGRRLKHFFQSLWLKWKLVVLPVLIKWGILGAFAVGAVDSSTIPVPVDALIAVWVWKDRSHFWAYCIAAAAGSAVGGLLPYALGRAGGELFILKHVNRARYERMKLRFEKQEFLAMAIPSALPPPTPWKACVFAAGVFEMRVAPFMLAVFVGRLVRWMVLSLLVIKFGTRAVDVMAHHALTALLVVGGLSLIGFAAWWMRKGRKAAERQAGSSAESS